MACSRFNVIIHVHLRRLRLRWPTILLDGVTRGGGDMGVIIVVLWMSLGVGTSILFGEEWGFVALLLPIILLAIWGAREVALGNMDWWGNPKPGSPLWSDLRSQPRVSGGRVVHLLADGPPSTDRMSYYHEKPSGRGIIETGWTYCGKWPGQTRVLTTTNEYAVTCRVCLRAINSGKK